MSHIKKWFPTGLLLLSSACLVYAFTKVAWSQSTPSDSYTPGCYMDTPEGQRVDLTELCGSNSNSNREPSSNSNPTSNQLPHSSQSGSTNHNSEAEALSEREFLEVSEGLAKTYDVPSLYEGGDNQPLTFNSELASEKGFSPESIQLAEDLTAYQNALTAAQQKALNGDTSELENLDVSNYPVVEAYFEAADNFSQSKDLTKSIDSGNENTKDQEKAQNKNWWAEYTCGTWWKPRPSRAASWRRWNVSNGDSTLRSWGYHPTPSWAGGGYTRPRTYKPWVCGWNTYRDHGYTMHSNRTVMEQKYSGWSPPGEPNPEVWRSGPHPHPHWAAYVRWWHWRY